jgi:integrase
MDENLVNRGGTWYLRKRWEGGQPMVSLRTSKKANAKTKANRFLTILEESKSWETAVEDLKGKKILRKGEDPTIESIETLYREFMGQSVNPVKEETIKHNIQCLKRMMAECGAKTVARIDCEKFRFTAENRSNLTAQIRAARSVFKVAALHFYKKKGFALENPFGRMERHSEKPQPYIPLSAATRSAIWKECRDLEPESAMIVLLALGCGLRRNEIDKARKSWLCENDGMTVLTVQNESDFEPKSRISRNIPVSQALADEILRIRKSLKPKSNDPYLIPTKQPTKAKLRLNCRFRKVSKWLTDKGIPETKSVHALRKEFGSLVATKHGIFTASTYLGHSSVVITQESYGSLVGNPTVDMEKLIHGDKEEEIAKAMAIVAKHAGVTQEGLQKALEALK